MLRYGVATIRRCNDTTMLRYVDATTRRYHDTTTLRYGDATILRHDNTTIRRCHEGRLRYNHRDRRWNHCATFAAQLVWIFLRIERNLQKPLLDQFLMRISKMKFIFFKNFTRNWIKTSTLYTITVILIVIHTDYIYSSISIFFLFSVKIWCQIYYLEPQHVELAFLCRSFWWLNVLKWWSQIGLG